LKYIPSIIIEETLNFLINEKLINENINIFYNGEKYSHQNFYKWQRKRLNILIEKDGTPTGGTWSYDKDNRKKIPKNTIIPSILKLNNNKYIDESKIYVEKYFNNNYGSLDNFIYPINHEDSKEWLLYFLKYKFENFGIYEDAESDKDPFLFHSVLTPMMNIGLLTDNEILNIVLKYQNKVPIESFEGFIRQIIGWREFSRYMYEKHSSKYINKNFFNAKKKLNKEWYNGTTEILPIDITIKKAFKYGYLHHIERLMIIANYMTLIGYHPTEMYKWFMEFSIDSYDWVMEYNIYCMASYSDGGKFTSKPYISSSKYIIKMSNYNKYNNDLKWTEKWDQMFWKFMKKHKNKIKKIGRLAMLLKFI
jgi:deoxyribodipyrimidine photolyase-related protein